jgi:hypothetical protein
LRRGEVLHDPKRLEWVEANRERYVNKQSGVNAALDLGQWYIMYKALFPNTTHPSHPCEYPRGASCMLEHIGMEYGTDAQGSSLRT